MSDEMKPLTEREILLVEEMGVMRRIYEIDKLLITCLTVRCGGTVTIDQDELDFTRKNYMLTEEVSHSDLTHSAKLMVRLK